MTELLDRDLDYYDAVAASDTPFELKVLKRNGSEDGLVLKVLGSECEKVQAEINKLVNGRRKQQAQAEAMASRIGVGATPVVTVEDDIAFGHRLAAVRVVGWNLKTPFTPEGAHKLVSRHPDISKQVLDASNDLGNFMKASSEA
jgi:hypothetical protein